LRAADRRAAIRIWPLEATKQTTWANTERDLTRPSAQPGAASRPHAVLVWSLEAAGAVVPARVLAKIASDAQGCNNRARSRLMRGPLCAGIRCPGHTRTAILCDVADAAARDRSEAMVVGKDLRKVALPAPSMIFVVTPWPSCLTTAVC
jgi:hypothetical protein